MNTSNMLYLVAIKCILLYNFVGTEVYTVSKAKEVFNFYKDKYDKKYKSENAENYAFTNFITNINTVEALNANRTAPGALYILNRFADINPVEYQEKYAVSVRPYDNVLGQDMKSQILRQKNNKKVIDAELYDLDKADELYKEFLRKHNKTIGKGKYRQKLHYLRFVKSLVEKNRNIVSGNTDTANLEIDADVVKNPHEFFI